MSLIINKPWEMPQQHWVEGKGGKLEIKSERRPASYEVFDSRNNTKRKINLNIHICSVYTSAHLCILAIL